MNRFAYVGCLVAGLAVGPALAQTSSSTAGSGSSSVSSGSSAIRPLRSSPSLSSGRAATSVEVPRPATDPNSQVAPSATTLPGGGSQEPYTPGSDADGAVPVWGTQDNSSAPGVSEPINESSARSSDSSCTGTGTRSSSGSGSASVTTSSCAASSLGTMNIMGSGGSIDVSGN